ncbi:thiol peroxidase [candidate division WOR-3 bacterium]|nr:thiol peroxidase [candidate division WOR-3 bacterium]
MPERKGLVTFGGKPVTLVGDELGVGDRMPDVVLVGNDMKEAKLGSFAGKVLVLSAVASLDTSTCDIETRRFNAEAVKLGDDVRVVTVSMDLPFAQKRWCGAAGVDRVVTLSDHRDAEFGNRFGVLMKENRLLARAVFVVDRQGAVRYIQLVPEVGQEPDYEAVLAAVRELTVTD